jgi:cytochrome c biogenesis protein CcmG, thiol:disulfide interchange protein DsbE
MSRSLKLGAQALALGAVVGLLALLVWKVVNNGGRTKKPENFTLTRLDRPGRIELSSLRGKAVVLNFWASWCVPCKKEAPRLEAAWQRYRTKGVVVIGVDANDFASDAKTFMRRYGVTYPVVHDGAGTTLTPYGITGFPETVFIDRRGRFVGDHVVGAVTSGQLTGNIERALSS